MNELQTIIRAYTLTLMIYHDEVIGRVSFTRENGTIEASALYSLSELNNIITLWRSNGLMGSFGIGTQLAASAEFTLQGVTL